MIWGILGLIGGGSFIVNGFSVLTDPDCSQVGFSGGRAVSVTCFPAGSIGGDMPGTIGGLGMLFFGGLLLWLSWKSFTRNRY